MAIPLAHCWNTEKRNTIKHFHLFKLKYNKLKIDNIFQVQHCFYSPLRNCNFNSSLNKTNSYKNLSFFSDILFKRFIKYFFFNLELTDRVLIYNG